MPDNETIFGSSILASLAQEVGLILFDVGSRGGIFEDFLPAANSTTAIGFEPDAQECDRLNHAAANSSGSWKSEIHYPVALGVRSENLELHICRQPACSSTLEPSSILPLEFGRQDDFEVTDHTPLAVEPLDKFCEDNGITDVDFLKVDVQGGEMAVLQGGKSIIGEHLLGLRAEVEFAPLYKQQPLFSEMEIYLREFGFYPADWVFQRYWRHNPNQEHGQYSRGSIPYSRGRIVHSDILFLRDHQWILEHMADANLKLCRLIVIALLYHQVDLAAQLIKRIKSSTTITKYDDAEWARELRNISHYLYRSAHKKQFYEWARRLKKFISK